MAKNKVNFILTTIQVILSYCLVSSNVYVESSSNCSILLLFNYKAEKQEVIVPNVSVVIYRAGAKPDGFHPSSDKAANFIYSRQVCVLALCYFGSTVPPEDFNKNVYKSSYWMAVVCSFTRLGAFFKTNLARHKCLCSYTLLKLKL